MYAFLLSLFLKTNTAQISVVITSQLFVVSPFLYVSLSYLIYLCMLSRFIQYNHRVLAPFIVFSFIILCLQNSFTLCVALIC